MAAATQEIINKKSNEDSQSTWNNKDNIGFYENVPIDVLREMAVVGGFENGCDVNLIYPLIENAASILEVGAAYGRVINRLLQNGYDGKVYAIERSSNFYHYLKQSFPAQAEIIHADVMDYQLPFKVDVVLYMWSNISEFPKEQQPDVLKHLSSWINTDGMLIVETSAHTITPQNATHFQNQTYQVNTPYGTGYGYIPSSEEIEEYARKAGFKKIHHLPYKTDRNRERIVHVLRF